MSAHVSGVVSEDFAEAVANWLDGESGRVIQQTHDANGVTILIEAPSWEEAAGWAVILVCECRNHYSIDAALLGVFLASPYHLDRYTVTLELRGEL